MNVTTSYKIMGLDENATLETLKKQYRLLAFQFHPDLNQNDPQAAKKFQEINEAYIILQEEIAKGTSRKFTTRIRRKPTASQNQERARAPFRQTTQTEQGQQARQKKEQIRKERQEKILKDILKDPFAKKVYEDIFLRLKDGKPKYSPAHQDTNTANARPNPLTRLKSWLHKRADIRETVHVAAKKLIPGNTINITITHPLTGSPISLDVRLPYDFSVGRILRLKKKGKNLGLWKGDLYLRFLPK